MMGLEGFLLRIRRRESRVYSLLKDFYFFLIRGNVPAPRVIFRPIYEALVIWRFLKGFIPEKLFYVPIFKSRCEKCGKGLSLPNGIPWIEGNMILMIGDNVMLDGNAFASGHVYEKPTIKIGNDSGLGYKTWISVSKLVEIGNNCMISGGCFIADNDGHPIDPQKRLRKEGVTEKEIRPVSIKDNVWVGTGAVILRGVTIGQGSIIAANSLVTRSIPEYSIAMGVPAKVVLSGIDRIDTEGKRSSAHEGVEPKKRFE